MTVKNTESLGNSSSENRSLFYCPEARQYFLALNHTSFKITVAITTIACPVIILLNLLVIIAVKSRRELKKNSNILLSSVTLADLLVGAVSMPLSIGLDALVIERVSIADVTCTMLFISASVLYTFCAGASFFHLLLIAWERYVAIAKWMEYKTIVTTGRVNKYTRVAWLLTVLMVVPLVMMDAVNVRYEIKLVVDVIMSIFLFVCISLIAYFYVKAYLAFRNWNRTRIRPVDVLLKGKLESKFAHTTFWLTVFVGVSTLPISSVHLFHGALPFFRLISTIRWAETILQLNSLFNPLLYWYRNSRLRKPTLKLLCRRNRPASRTVHSIRQRHYSLASLDVEKLQNEQREQGLLRSESLGAMIGLHTFRQRRSEAVKERPMSAPSRVASD